MDTEAGLQTEKKEVVVSKRGSKSATRQTKRAHESSRQKQRRLEKPTSTAKEVFVVQSNLKRNGTQYVQGDKFAERMCEAIQTLLDAGVVRKEGSIKEEEKIALENELAEEAKKKEEKRKAKEIKKAKEIEESAAPSA